MPGFLEALRTEIRDIKAELAADPRYIKLKSLRNVLALYESSGGDRDENDDAGVEVSLPARTITRVPSEARSRAMELAELYLRNRSGPTPTREILDHIVALGGEIGGREPVSNLSAMLSNSGKFQSHGRAGWTLADPEVEVLGDSTVSDVVQYIMADLTSDQIFHAYSFYETNNKIAQDLDARLLSDTRRRINRHLTDNEMRTIRSEFGKALREAALT